MNNTPRVPGRAYTDGEKRAIVERLFWAWTQNPSLRLGQLIANAMDPEALFYIEDFDLVEEVEHYTVR